MTTIESLLSHHDWLRDLAQRLVTDPNRADDVAQATWVEAVERPPARLDNPRGWLARVVRNAARDAGRSESRRRLREQAAARSEATPDTSETVERAQLQRLLVDEVLALPERYRDVVLLRFFDDLKPAAIAKRLDCPVDTVHTRLQRGIGLLRERLDATHGNRADWQRKLIVSFSLGAVPVAGWSGSMLAIGALALCVTLGGAWFGLVGRNAETAADTDAIPRSAAAVIDNKAATDDTSVRREVVSVDPASPAQPVEASGPLYRGRAISPLGQPLADLRIGFRNPDYPSLTADGNGLRVRHTTTRLDDSLRAMLADPANVEFISTIVETSRSDQVAALLRGEPIPVDSVSTDRDGRFELRGPKDADDLLLSDEQSPPHAGLGVFGAMELADGDHVLVCGPVVDLFGQVRGTHGEPLEDVYVSVSFDLDSLPGFPSSLRGSAPFVSRNTQSDRAGQFALRDVPRHAGIRVIAQKRGHRDVSLPTLELDGRAVDWSLPELKGKRYLTGSVLRADGSPATEARVTFGQDGASTDAAGSFSILLSYFDDQTLLIARERGKLPSIVRDLAPQLRAEPDAGKDLLLHLGGQPFTIEGRIVDADGRPLAGYRVGIVDGTRDGSIVSASLEDALAGLGSNDLRRTTGADGAFRLNGLLSRTYSIRAYDPKTLVSVIARDVAAGTSELTLRIPREPLLDEVRGRIVDLDGLPLAGVKLRLGIETTRIEWAGNSHQPSSKSVTSAADGSFVLHDVPSTPFAIETDGEEVEGCWYTVDPSDPRSLELAVDRIVSARIRIAEGHGADNYRLLDAGGSQLQITVHRPDVLSATFTVRIDAPADTPRITVSSRARQLELRNGKQVLRTLPIQLPTGRGVIEVDV